MGFWGRHLAGVGLLTLLAAILWPMIGAGRALAVYAVLLLIVLVHHLRNLAALERWLRKPGADELPQGYGSWEQIFSDLSRMLRLQSQSESKLTATLARFQLAGAAMPEGVVILDDADRIEWCNPRAEQHFGVSNHSDRGQQITYLVRHPQFAEYLHAQNYREPLVLRPAHNLEVVLSVQLVPYGDKQKLIISRDISRWEQLETMRRDFIANVSHELRTPLTVIGGFLETINDEPRPDAEMVRRSLHLMLDQTRRMQHLVEDLLTLSRLESAQNPLSEDRVNVPELLHSLHHDALALSAGHHRIHLRLDSQAWLLGNGDELRSAFSNLISNAVRYTPQGGEITLAWRERDGMAVFSAQDSGIGIEAAHIPRLTERFYRVDRSRSRETGGTGLGLAIVKHVLNRHQARLDIASEPGRGSEFSAAFPATRVLQEETSADQSAA